MQSTSELELTSAKSAFTNSGVRGQNEEGLLNSSMKITIAVFVILPLLAVIAAIPLAILWAGFFTWVDVGLILFFWALTAGGITLGYHRYFTHGAFKAPRAVKIVLAIAGSMAIQGSLDQWVADHRKHHQFSDEVGDPHSPWRFGTGQGVADGC